jgi:signal transduction histidine kinase
MTAALRDRLALVVAGALAVLSLIALLAGRVDPGVRLAVEGDQLVVAEVLPWSSAAVYGAQPGQLVVSIDYQRVFFPSDMPPGPEEHIPSAEELSSLADVGPAMELETVPLDAAVATLKELGTQSIQIDGSYQLQNTSLTFALGLLILTFGAFWLRLGRAVPSLVPLAIPVAVGAAIPLLALPLLRTSSMAALVVAGVLLPLGMLPLAHALSERIADPRDRRLAWATARAAARKSMLRARLPLPQREPFGVPGDVARWLALGAVATIPGIAAAAPSLLRPPADGARPGRLIESTEYAIAGLTTLVSAWVLVGSPWEPSTVPIVLWLLAIVIAGRLTIRPLLRLAQRATMHRDLVIAAAEAERTRLAADLHDDALQELTLLVRRLDALGDEEGARIARGVADRLRAICGDLRLPILDDLGAGPALEWLVERVSRVAGTPVTLDRHDAVRPPPDVELTVFRVTQEALSNAVRHGQPPVVVRYAATASGVSLTIDDAGPGIDRRAADRAPRDGHFGLLNMAQRADQIGAILDIRRWPAGGTHVALDWRPAGGPPRPLPDDDDTAVIAVQATGAAAGSAGS